MVSEHKLAFVWWDCFLFRGVGLENPLCFVVDRALVGGKALLHVSLPLNSMSSVSLWCLVPWVFDQVESELVRVAFETALKGRAVVREVAWAAAVDDECDGDLILCLGDRDVLVDDRSGLGWCWAIIW